MEIKIVKRPIQNENTKLDEIQYPNEKWCAKTRTYRDGRGGMKMWLKEIEQANPDIIYLYDIYSWKEKVTNPLDEDDWIEDTFYNVRCAFKKFPIEDESEQ